MDAVSYSLASKQAQRIEKFIENPDSTSGIVTVPKTIASGETVTIPAGRVAVLPNVVVDGDLVVEDGGDVFVPAGATFGDLETQLALKAPLSSPAFTGIPIAPTQTAQDNSTKLATTAYVDGKMVLGTVVNATGTAVDFTGIPSWVKKITILFNGLSPSGSNTVCVRVGSGSVATTGYTGTYSAISASVATIGYSTAFEILGSGSAVSLYGKMSIYLISGNTYIEEHILGRTTNIGTYIGGGSITLSKKIDRVRITTVEGANTFIAGSINIMYEG